MGYPSKGLGKCNVDGFLRRTLKEAGCEGICRNDSGYLFGFCRKLGFSSVLMAELWAVLTTIIVSLGRGLRKLIIESDSQTEVKLILESLSHSYSTRI